MAGMAPVVRTTNQDIDGILSGLRWDSLDLTYSFPIAATDYGTAYGYGEAKNNFQPLTSFQSATVRKIFGMISDVTGLKFTEIQETPALQADLRLARSDETGSAWTYFPASAPEGGDTWFRTSGGWFDQPVSGNYAYYVFIHEVLHGIGLKHGNETSSFGAMTTEHDSMEYSLTTYRSYVGASGLHVENEGWSFGQTLMMYDIAALQRMYGANFSTRNDDTIYCWSPTTGEAFIDGVGQGAPGANRIFMTLWDGGGNDTFDFSNYRTGLSVDLRPGEWSTTSTAQLADLGGGRSARGTIANALLYDGDPRSLIENALGGRAGDALVGNAAANRLKGGAGGDRLSGLDGADTLHGGTGKDVLIGGQGRDVFVFDTKPKKAVNLDHVLDFAVTDDTIHLENAEFLHLGRAGRLPSPAFWTGARAHDRSDRVIYDRETGALYYDPDGTGACSQIKFAQLSKGLKMTAGDFRII
ncbi:M10 family metallopeptidase C-terminal domain-containing protein [Microvirga mediterraneensis]|uniref:M10 family metallopeptidase C-terminal domain-containing protein n=1 Tax=Microvirga mediterraneensis TaxID=2754695 RepID=A0A838BR91_9HYPH|nr:M10 family metallopeptidase C-terminal domain-containing protein [Microvirga mediterraneensis]MBA1157525.1 M10 family metallopeptidase C-terminal domain-containing protein [Microvirga mediterraneensis]